LINGGADVNFRTVQKGNHQFTSLLMLAAGRSSQEAAEMMRLLLLSGADPNAYVKSRKKGELRTVAMQRGAKQLPRWLGMTWDELVTWTTDRRSKGLQEEELARLYPQDYMSENKPGPN
jgi:hypothetical protein